MAGSRRIARSIRSGRRTESSRTKRPPKEWPTQPAALDPTPRPFRSDRSRASGSSRADPPRVTMAAQVHRKHTEPPRPTLLHELSKPLSVARRAMNAHDRRCFAVAPFETVQAHPPTVNPPRGQAARGTGVGEARALEEERLRKIESVLGALAGGPMPVAVAIRPRRRRRGAPPQPEGGRHARRPEHPGRPSAGRTDAGRSAPVASPRLTSSRPEVEPSRAGSRRRGSLSCAACRSPRRARRACRARAP